MARRARPLSRRPGRFRLWLVMEFHGLPTSRGVDAGGGEEVPPTEGKGRWAF